MLLKPLTLALEESRVIAVNAEPTATSFTAQGASVPVIAYHIGVHHQRNPMINSRSSNCRKQLAKFRIGPDPRPYHDAMAARDYSYALLKFARG